MHDLGTPHVLRSVISGRLLLAAGGVVLALAVMPVTFSFELATVDWQTAAAAGRFRHIACRDQNARWIWL